MEFNRQVFIGSVLTNKVYRFVIPELCHVEKIVTELAKGNSIL
jgi:hypothetical protein